MEGVFPVVLFLSYEIPLPRLRGVEVCCWIHVRVNGLMQATSYPALVYSTVQVGGRLCRVCFAGMEDR